ncbi:MAG: META domain-containing protein [Candidatus Aminicenantes bacterium]|nr:META domain-containing protein [Candidatus Aminicenantes bacterium]NIM78187.1 META domain-containing protein [Candidatus Aminicenantes bacterium]NIN17524.1 META domain-containing protein [Candidatus Aminicenantes bacterium]NIN41410.1 META domain-containing protein [Candidatus Aminicenantes bacterium]NIN84176.1 META domain-containing protein [Candidatus Aminicenantes bacterium]
MKRLLLMTILVVCFVGVTFHPGCKTDNPNSNSDLLFNIKWVLESIHYSTLNIVSIQDTFSILFRQNGSMDLEVDCNTCSGTFELGNNGAITIIDHSLCTEADCGPDSRDAEFHTALDGVTRYEIDGNNLRLFFTNGQSRLNFTKSN